MDLSPLHDLVILTPRLSLRVPNPQRLQRLADVAARGIHMPDIMPFGVPWTATSPTDPTPCPPDVLRRRVIDHHSSLLDPDLWADHLTKIDSSESHAITLPLTVSLRAYGADPRFSHHDHTDQTLPRDLVDDDPYPDPYHVIGVITLKLTFDYASTSLTDHQHHNNDRPVITVSTGSWLGLTHQRRGYGTEMRAAVLNLAFDHLGATLATSRVHTDNPRSFGVSEELGYTVLDDRHSVLFPSSMSRSTNPTHDAPFDHATGRSPIPVTTYVMTAADFAVLRRPSTSATRDADNVRPSALSLIHISTRNLTPLVRRLLGTSAT